MNVSLNNIIRMRTLIVSLLLLVLLLDIFAVGDDIDRTFNLFKKKKEKVKDKLKKDKDKKPSYKPVIARTFRKRTRIKTRRSPSLPISPAIILRPCLATPLLITVCTLSISV